MAALRFDLSAAARVRARVLDVTDRMLAVLADRALAAGSQELHWDGRGENGLAPGSGTYFVLLEVVSESGATEQRMLPLIIID